jgi:hypothetical protein
MIARSIGPMPEEPLKNEKRQNTWQTEQQVHPERFDREN